MKIKTMIVMAAATLLAITPMTVRADLHFSFSYVDQATAGDAITASGILTTSDILTPITGMLGVSGYQITGISGVRNGLAITGLNPNPNFPSTITKGYVYNAIYDNALTVNPLGLNWNGLSYFVGSDEYNIFSVNFPTGGGYMEDMNARMQPVVVDLAIAPVPEPSTYVAGAMLLIPFGMSVIRGMRKNSKA